MKKTLISLILAVVMIFTTACTSFESLINEIPIINEFSGGSEESVPTEAVAIVLGIHGNFPTVSFNMYYQHIYDACYSYGEVYCFVIDGSPRAIGSYSINASDKKIDDEKRKQLARVNAEAIVRECASSTAITPEIDTLSAIHMSAEALANSSADEKKLIIVDSFLPTAGLISFLEANYFDSDPEYIVQQLRDIYSLPALDGVSIHVYGMGQTAGSQARLTASCKYKLRTFWEYLLISTGANEVIIDDSPLGDLEPDPNLPFCSAIPIPLDVIEASNVAEDPNTMFADNNIIVIDETTVKFKANRAEFADIEAAKQVLMPIAETLKNNCDLEISIFGMTATYGTIAGCDRLSLKRANACKDLLISFGANKNQIYTYGLGQRKCFLRVVDINPDTGNLIESKARLNRAIYVVKRDSTESDLLESIAANV